MKNFVFIFVCFYHFVGVSQVVEDFAGVSTLEGFQNNSSKDNSNFNNPHGIDIAPDGTIYIADRFNHAIRKIDTLGVVTTIAGNGAIGDQDGPGTQAQFHEPWDVCAGNNGEVYVADAKNNKIRVIYADGTVATLAGTGNAGFKDASNPLASTFFWPSGVEYDHEKELLYVAGHLSHLIRTIASNGTVSTYAGTKTNFPNNFGSSDGFRTTASFYRPYGIHLGKNRTLYVADEWNSLIRSIDTNGIVSTLGGSPQIDQYQNGGPEESLYNYPWDITTDDNGSIYILDGFNHVIRKIDPNTLESTLFAGTTAETGATNGPVLEARFNGATNLEYSAFDGSLYIADAFNHVIRRIKLLENINISLASPLSCYGDSLKLLADKAYYDFYHWYEGTTLIATTTTPYLNKPYNQESTIHVIGERLNIGTAFSDTLQLQPSNQDIAKITTISSSPYCTGDTIILNSNSTDVLWSTGDTTANIAVTTSGQYAYQRRNGDCLIEFDTIDITFSPTPVITVSPDEPLITEDDITLTATGADAYIWSTDETGSSIIVDTPQLIIVQGTSIEGCPSEPVSIEVTSIPPITANPDYVLLPFRTPTLLDVLENDAFENTPTLTILDETPPITLLQSNGYIQMTNNDLYHDTSIVITYSICYAETNRCDTTTIMVEVESADLSFDDGVFIPEAFSPNNDAVNDAFEIIPSNPNSTYGIEIFNRWGQSVYQNKNYNNDWFGTNNSEEDLLEGTYFYIVNDLFTLKTYSGYVVIKR